MIWNNNIPEKQPLVIEALFSDALVPDQGPHRAARLIDNDGFHEALIFYYGSLG